MQRVAQRFRRLGLRGQRDGTSRHFCRSQVQLLTLEIYCDLPVALAFLHQLTVF